MDRFTAKIKLEIDDRSPCRKFKSRQTANQRERFRMQQISDAFDGLRQHLTEWVPEQTKLSKLSTLRMAILKIKYLESLINDDISGEEQALLQLHTTWDWQHQNAVRMQSNNTALLNTKHPLYYYLPNNG